jgi:hypothetical protein
MILFLFVAAFLWILYCANILFPLFFCAIVVLAIAAAYMACAFALFYLLEQIHSDED